jgi:Spy/CpxP family protein refolding chaperone
MKKILITVGLLIGLVGAGYSQDTPQRKGHGAGQPHREMKSPDERAKMSTEALEKKLNLTPEQKEKVYALQLDRANKMGKMHEADATARKNQMEKRKELMAEGEKKMNKILTEEQQKTLEEMKAKGKERMKEHKRPMQGSRKG